MSSTLGRLSNIVIALDRRGAGQGDGGGDGGGDEDTRDSAQADEAGEAAEHTASRPFRIRHRLDRRGDTWAIP